MTFAEAGQSYAALRAEYDAGRMPPANFQAAVEQLKVQDPGGVWWQMTPAGEWLSWNGSAWVPAAAAPAPTQPSPGALPVPGKGRQMFFDVVSVIGSCALSGAWYWYSSLDKYARPDYKTCAAMVLLPILLIVLRGPLDKLLAPLQGVRRKIPPMVLVGVSLAIPLLVTSALYSSGVVNYPLMLKSYLISTLLGFVLLRTPNVRPYGGRP